MSSSTKFSSEGFDLDAAANTSSSDGDGAPVVFEIGGGVSVDKTAAAEKQQKQPPAAAAAVSDTDESKKEEAKTNEEKGDVMAKADAFKQDGNEAFKSQNWLEAYDCYTAAIEATPGDLTGEQLLKLRDEWRQEQIKEQRRKMDEQETERSRKQQQKREREKSGESSSRSDDKEKEEDDDDDDDDDKEQQKEPPSPPPRFQPPPHVHGTKLAVYYANRAATCLHLEHYEAAVRDGDVAILYNPVYTKAYLRRSAAHEKLEQTEEALEDAKSALATVCSSTTSAAAERTKIQKLVARLQKLEDERLEKLKAETMDKLKDLGNSILGNFGLSLDNFQTVQDPKTGSYSISFNQNNGGGESK